MAAAGTATFGLAAGSAEASAISSCTSTTGTIVAVDFAHWSGPLVAGCDTTPPSSGYALLYAEGFQTTGDHRDGPGLICRVGNGAFDGGTEYPTSATDKCIVTPPESASWSYWISGTTPSTTNTFTYSSLGAMSDKPKAGEVELWIFGNTDDNPTCTPDAIRNGSAGHCSPVGPPVKSTPPHSTAPSTSHHATAPTTHAAGASSRANAPAGSSTSSAALHTGASSTPRPTGSAATNATGTAGSSTATGGALALGGGPTDPSPSSGGVVNAKPAAKSHHSAGSAAPVIATVGILAVLLAGAGYTRWRRTRPSTD
jgi:hypothetical protein